MSKEYGLILPGKSKPLAGPSVFGDDSSDSDEPPRRPTGLPSGANSQHALVQARALAADPTVYQYDEVYDAIDAQRKQSKLSRSELAKRPKYIARLLQTAERRKRENERRVERQVQREREAEGEAFRDKEEFVTGTYKRKLEELRAMEEEERREAYLEAVGDVTKQGNLDGFYRHLYEQKVGADDKVEEKGGEKVDQKVEEKVGAKRRRYRAHAANSGGEEEVEERKEHLQSNLDADSDFSIDSESETELEEVAKVVGGEKEAKVEEVEAKLDEIVVEVSKEVDVIKPKIDIWKKRTVGDLFDEAVKRYFERRAIREL